MRRRVLEVDDATLLALDAEPSLPQIVRPAIDGIDLEAWISRHDRELQSLLSRHGALLLRGFAVADAPQFARLVSAAGGAPFHYLERSTPRTPVIDGVHSSTDYPPEQTIALHNENAYASRWPDRVWFWCETPATSGGETTLADLRRVTARIAPALRARFDAVGVLYVRVFGNGLGLSLAECFQSRDRAAVAAQLTQAGYAIEWLGGERLRTRRVGQALCAHPANGERLWFNHAAFFHASSLPAEIRHGLARFLADDEWPHQTFYGDGSPIAAAELDEIRTAYDASRIAVRWQPGDVLVVDNLRVAHGRLPFTGTRRVRVALRSELRQDTREQ